MTAAPQLRFRLPGEWISLDPRDEDSARAHSATIARELVGPADDAAALRRRVHPRPRPFCGCTPSLRRRSTTGRR